MRALFNPDSMFMRFMSRMGDLLLLNFFFLITSLPIFTVGASLTAMYTVCFRFGTDREMGTTRSFFKAFRDNFKQATVLWLILLVLMVMCCVNIVLFFLMRNTLHYLWILFALLLGIALLIFCLAFPLLSQFDNTVKTTFKNALLLSIAYLPRAALIALMWAFPIWLLFQDIYLFLQCGFIFIALYFAILTFFGSKLLTKVFAPFMPQEDEDETTDTQEDCDDRS